MIVWAHKTAILILIFLDEKINQENNRYITC